MVSFELVAIFGEQTDRLARHVIKEFKCKVAIVSQAGPDVWQVEADYFHPDDSALLEELAKSKQLLIVWDNTLVTKNNWPDFKNRAHQIVLYKQTPCHASLISESTTVMASAQNSTDLDNLFYFKFQTVMTRNDFDHLMACLGPSNFASLNTWDGMVTIRLP
jgi:hypothetical protein